jgi:hypothetical protein
VAFGHAGVTFDGTRRAISFGEAAMKRDTPHPQDNLDSPVACDAAEPKEVELSSEYSLSFYLSHPGTVIEKDSMPFSALVHLQQRADLMAYLRTLQNHSLGCAQAFPQR